MAATNTENTPGAHSTPAVGVWSEAGVLRKVLVCSPGLAHLRLTPDTAAELLYDDVLWVQQAKRDHFDFVAKMRERDIEVLELPDLLTEVVATTKSGTAVLIADSITISTSCRHVYSR